MTEKEYKTTPAQRKANAKYDKKNMVQIGLKMKHEERKLYQEQADSYNMTVSAYIKKAVKYCIENNINLTETKPEEE